MFMSTAPTKTLVHLLTIENNQSFIVYLFVVRILFANNHLKVKKGLPHYYTYNKKSC